MRDQNLPTVLPFQDAPAAMHRRQMLRQVWLPLIATLVIVLALVVFAIVGTVQGSPQVNRWGNISAVLIILPMMLGGLILLAIFGGTAYGVRKLLQKMPGWMLRAQIFMWKLSRSVRSASDAAARPVFVVNHNTTRARAFWDRVFRRRSGQAQRR
jgi:hypothetical protein